MKIIEKEISSKKVLDTLIAQATVPMIISISRRHSFGAHWLQRILKKIQLGYGDQIEIHAFYLENPTKIMAILGEGRALVIYFVKENEIKSHLTGSVSKATFDAKLAMILSGNETFIENSTYPKSYGIEGK